MALAAQNQVRNLYVGLDFPGHASVSALKSGSNGDLALLSADGTAILPFSIRINLLSR